MICKKIFFFLQITIEAIESDVDEIALQGIEFWSTVCDEEVDLAIELSEVCFRNFLKQFFEDGQVFSTGKIVLIELSYLAYLMVWLSLQHKAVWCAGSRARQTPWKNQHVLCQGCFAVFSATPAWNPHKTGSFYISLLTFFFLM